MLGGWRWCGASSRDDVRGATEQEASEEGGLGGDFWYSGCATSGGKRRKTPLSESQGSTAANAFFGDGHSCTCQRSRSGVCYKEGWELLHLNGVLRFVS